MDGTERVMVVVVAFQEAEAEAEAEVGGTQYKFCPMWFVDVQKKRNT